MRLLIKLSIASAVLAAIGYFSYAPATNYLRERNKPKWETAKVVRGNAVRVINSSGTVRPVLQVSVGSFVSGPIVELNVDFNDEVAKGDLLAKIDPRLFIANVQRDEASLATRESEVSRVKAQLQQARNNLRRGQRLRETNEDYLSDREMDALRFECEALEASLKVAQASVLQAEAGLENSRANLEYTEIRSPVDGVVIDRKIDPGQTLAAQFQTPELFILAPDLRKKMHIYASVNEMDIGLIGQAKSEKRPVTFTVDAYPDDLFVGEIEQIRMSSTDVQGVVSYPVIVAAANPELKLLPGMTAEISFEVDNQKDVLKIPSQALGFVPDNVQYVREEDRGLLDDSRWKNTEDSTEGKSLSAEETAEARKNRNKRHVWMESEKGLKAVEIESGFSESSFTLLVSGDLEEGAELVTGQAKKK